MKKPNESPTQTADRLQNLVFRGDAVEAYNYALDQKKAASDGNNVRATVHYHRVSLVLLERF